MSIRASETLKNRMNAAARTNGRSLSAEAEFRLEQSFHEDRTFEALAEVGRMIRQMIDDEFAARTKLE